MSKPGSKEHAKGDERTARQKAADALARSRCGGNRTMAQCRADYRKRLNAGDNRTMAQKALDKRRCKNGECPMTREEILARRAQYRAEIKANPFRLELQRKYYRKRYADPAIRERKKAQARELYQRNLEKERERARKKMERVKADPEKHEHMLALRRERRRMQGAEARLLERLPQMIRQWERVMAEGRADAYLRKSRGRTRTLFLLWRDHRADFDTHIAFVRKMRDTFMPQRKAALKEMREKAKLARGGGDGEKTMLSAGKSPAADTQGGEGKSGAGQGGDCGGNGGHPESDERERDEIPAADSGGAGEV